MALWGWGDGEEHIGLRGAERVRSDSLGRACWSPGEPGEPGKGDKSLWSGDCVQRARGLHHNCPC